MLAVRWIEARLEYQRACETFHRTVAAEGPGADRFNLPIARAHENCVEREPVEKAARLALMAARPEWKIPAPPKRRPEHDCGF